MAITENMIAIKEGFIQSCNNCDSKHQEGCKIVFTFSMISILYTINWLTSFEVLVPFLLRFQRNQHLLGGKTSGVVDGGSVRNVLLEKH